MKVCWVQDLSPWTELGGAQQTDKAHILHGIKIGHEIEVLLPGADVSLINWADLVIVSNASAFPIRLFEQMQKPYVFFLHDYWPLCRWRLYYPMLDKCRTCYPSQNWRPIFQRSKLIIWLSPLHRESWLFSFSELTEHPFALIPSPIDTEKFYDLKLERKGAIAVHSGVAFKGREHFVKWAEEHREIPITLVGETGGPLPANVKNISYVPQHEMNGLYNQHEVLVHLPMTPQPFERTVAEAVLAGCRIVANPLVGALSWDFFHDGRKAVVEALRCSSEKFWAAIEEKVNLLETVKKTNHSLGGK